jgi:hypothetical protein
VSRYVPEPPSLYFHLGPMPGEKAWDLDRLGGFDSMEANPNVHDNQGKAKSNRPGGGGGGGCKTQVRIAFALVFRIFFFFSSLCQALQTNVHMLKMCTVLGVSRRYHRVHNKFVATQALLVSSEPLSTHGRASKLYRAYSLFNCTPRRSADAQKVVTPLASSSCLVSPYATAWTGGSCSRPTR